MEYIGLSLIELNIEVFKVQIKQFRNEDNNMRLKDQKDKGMY
jgi:hypothetical protein